jgi:hypothetical protein
MPHCPLSRRKGGFMAVPAPSFCTSEVGKRGRVEVAPFHQRGMDFCCVRPSTSSTSAVLGRPLGRRGNPPFCRRGRRVLRRLGWGGSLDVARYERLFFLRHVELGSASMPHGWAESRRLAYWTEFTAWILGPKACEAQPSSG